MSSCSASMDRKGCSAGSRNHNNADDVLTGPISNHVPMRPVHKLMAMIFFVLCPNCKEAYNVCVCSYTKYDVC